VSAANAASRRALSEKRGIVTLSGHVDSYYKKWAATGDPRAPRYHWVDGTGRVDAVRAACLAALAN